MNERGMSTVAAVALAGAAGLLFGTLMMDWMVISVAPADGPSLTVPVPLLAARVATAAIPEQALADATVPEEARAQREAVLGVVRALVDAPDGTLVRVNSPDAKVDISTRGDDLLLAVDADEATVRCTLPLDGILDALERWDWERADPALFLRALGHAHGTLLEVEAEDGTRVKITAW